MLLLGDTTFSFVIPTLDSDKIANSQNLHTCIPNKTQTTAGHDVNTENDLLRQKVALLEKENANLKEQLKKLTGGVKAAIGEAKAKDAAINGK